MQFMRQRQRRGKVEVLGQLNKMAYLRTAHIIMNK